MNIGRYTFEEYVKVVESFHGYAAPGVVAGGFMVDLAVKNIPKDILYDAISETKTCLPDSIQLLTICSIGNGWLKVIHINRYALSLFDKDTGEGIRVFMDSEKVETWPEIKTWLFKLKPKKEQDSELLMEQIREAGPGILSMHPIKVKAEFLGKTHKGRIINCPICKEGFPVEDGEICLGCQGGAPYLDTA